MTQQKSHTKTILIICLILIVGTIVTYYRKNHTPIPSIYTAIPKATAANTTEIPETKLLIQVSGAVHNPGVYKISPGKRGKDALDLAGGPLPTADLDKVNLVALVKDGKRINVPHKKPTITPPISINHASQETLDAIPGISPKAALAIIENRPYQNLDDLAFVKGLGPTTLEKIKPFLTL